MEVHLEKGEEKELKHPDGISIYVSKAAFKTDVWINISIFMTTVKTDHALSTIERSFKVRSTVASKQPIRFSLRISQDILREFELKNSVVFIEIREGDLIRVVSGNLLRKEDGSETIYTLNGSFKLPIDEEIYITPGIMSMKLCNKEAFHPVPHHFKIGDLGRYDDGSCRRSDSENCTNPMPQGIYPACIPAGKASLYSAYQLVFPTQQRRWYVGTPLNHNPSPDEDGDFFSTMSVGAMGENKPSRVEDWLSGEQIELRTIHFELREDIPIEEAVEERAALIDKTVRCYVGGSLHTGNSRPVYIQHPGHGWIIVGVEKDGFWSHAQNPESAGLSDWCTWENAPWRNSSLDEHNQPWFQIIYPKNCNLRPIEKRLGSFSMWGSGGRGNNIQFVDLPSVNTIDWTPHKEASSAGVGYIWIEDNVPLDRQGIPITRRGDLWDDELGHRIPVPLNDYDECNCGNPSGCSNCRTRLHLPFWVHNTTKDELHRYRIDLKFWTADQRWVSLDAELMDPLEDGTTYPGFPSSYHSHYTMPGPGVREVFEIQAVPDRTDRAGGRHPYNWQPVGWYIDFHKDQLAYLSVHGLKLILYCVDINPEVNCQVQDVMQIWFKTQGEPMY